ncbi:MAG: hypothetical protein ACK4LQ_04710 [Pararhodobacter sp.]
MPFKTLLAALALSMAPSLALAMGCGDLRQTTASCAEGQVWDSASQSCVTPVSS